MLRGNVGDWVDQALDGVDFPTPYARSHREQVRLSFFFEILKRCTRLEWRTILWRITQPHHLADTCPCYLHELSDDQLNTLLREILRKGET